MLTREDKLHMASRKVDDQVARKARAEAILKARDLRNASLSSTASAQVKASPDEEPHDPNFVEFIDRKMKREKIE